MMGRDFSSTQNTPTTQRRVFAVAQYILYNVSNLTCKTPKHVGSAITVHHLTRSCQLLDLLHGQGHCVSYDDVCQSETATAVAVMSQITGQGDSFLPSNITPGNFVHAAMDNIDINEDARSGQGTTHVLEFTLPRKQWNKYIIWTQAKIHQDETTGSE